MNLVMCRSCGEFTSALKEDNRLFRWKTIVLSVGERSSRITVPGSSIEPGGKSNEPGMSPGEAIHGISGPRSDVIDMKLYGSMSSTFGSKNEPWDLMSAFSYLATYY